MDKTSANNEPPQTQPLDQPDHGILFELCGVGAWRFLWPLVLWGLDALSLVLLRPDVVGEPSGVLFIASFVAVILIWAIGARKAIRHGHNKMLVRMVAAVSSLGVSAGAAVVTMVARVAEVSAVGPEKARIFLTLGNDEEDPSLWIGQAEQAYVYYALPALVVLILVCWYLVGLGRARQQA